MAKLNNTIFWDLDREMRRAFSHIPDLKEADICIDKQSMTDFGCNVLAKIGLSYADSIKLEPMDTDQVAGWIEQDGAANVSVVHPKELIITSEGDYDSVYWYGTYVFAVTWTHFPQVSHWLALAREHERQQAEAKAIRATVRRERAQQAAAAAEAEEREIYERLREKYGDK